MIILFYFLFHCFSVDRSKYTDCNGTPFCKRNRFSENQKWIALSDLSISKNNTFSMPLLSEKTNVKVLLNVNFLLNSCFHVKITNFSEEKGPKRYDCSIENSIVNQKVSRSTKSFTEERNSTHIILTSRPQTKIIIQLNPFILFAFEGEIPKLAFNRDNSMIFEQPTDNDEDEESPEDAHKSVAASFDFLDPRVKFSGLPAHTFPLTLPDTRAREPHRFYNTDINRFEVDSGMAMYGSIPYLVGHSGPNTTSVFWCNPSETYVDVWSNENFQTRSEISSETKKEAKSEVHREVNSETKSEANNEVHREVNSETKSEANNEVHREVSSEANNVVSDVSGSGGARFVSETNYVDFFVFVGGHAEAVEQFSELTGRAPMQHYFTFGYHQCRWTYQSSNEIRAVSANLDDKRIPHDVLWLDLDHTDDKKYFTFNSNYADVLQLTKDVVASGRRLVAQVDPHLKATTSYAVYKEASDRHFLITDDQKGTFYGNCWPGRSAWVDFFNPNARLWWSRRFNYSLYLGSSKELFVWNDMNEPAVFDVKDFTLPKTSLHFRGFQDRSIHNLYGHFMVMSTYNGVVSRNEDHNERAFVLTRSYFAGSQKFALMWTGDNTASWEMLHNSLVISLHLAISSFPVSGSDVGGFFDSPNEDLLSRWYQLGSVAYPFFRCHCHHLSARREPDKLKGEFFTRARSAIVERYRLLPLWYSLMKESHDTGRPIVRPIWFEFDDESLDDIDDQLMIGEVILAAPVVTEKQSAANEREVTLPRGARWFEMRALQEVKSDGQKVRVKAKSEVPLFVRGGRTFCEKEILRKSSELMFNDPFTLVVCLDDQMRSEGRLYVDDGHTFDYTRGEFVYRAFVMRDARLMNTKEVNCDVKNEFYQSYRVVVKTIKVAGFDRMPTKVVNEVSGENVRFKVKSGVVIIDDQKLPVAEDWTLKFIF